MKKLLLVTSILGVLGVPWANADVEVNIINGSSSSGWIVCTGPASFTECSTGSIMVGNYRVALDTGVETDGSDPYLDLSYLANTGNSKPGSLTFEVIATGFSDAISQPQTNFQGNGNSSLKDTVSLWSYGGNSNADCSAGVNACTPSSDGLNLLQSALGLPENLNVSTANTGFSPSVDPYALALVLTLNNPAKSGNASGDIQLNEVPEPASIMLLGGVLLFTGRWLRRRSA